jgi:cytochrome c biogenesis protein ResB
MYVRDYDPITDKDAIEKLHSDMGMDYKFPDIDRPLFIVKKVCLNDEGLIIGTELLRIQAEAYLMLDLSLGAKAKVEAIEALSREVEASAWKVGIDDLVAYIPESISNKFSRLLSKLGWGKARDGWVTWVREIV